MPDLTEVYRVSKRLALGDIHTASVIRLDLPSQSVECLQNALMTENPAQMPRTQSATDKMIFKKAPIRLPCSMRRNVWRLNDENVV